MNDQDRNEGQSSGAGATGGGPAGPTGGSTGGTTPPTPPSTPRDPSGPGSPPGTSGPSGADTPSSTSTSPGVPVPPPPPPAMGDDRPSPPLLLDEDTDTVHLDEDYAEGSRAIGYGIGSVVAGALALYLFPAQFVLTVAFQRLQGGPTQLGNWYIFGWAVNLLPSALAGVFAIIAASRGDMSVEQGLGSGLSRVGRLLGWGAIVLLAFGVVALVMSLQPLPTPEAPAGFPGGQGGPG